jgi:LysR family hydrogen peroxide-inducible transcriptional activator
MPLGHPWESQQQIEPELLVDENVLLLCTGNCFRDQVLQVCPALNRSAFSSDGHHSTLEGSSLTTIRYMVASGSGVSVVPATSVEGKWADERLLVTRPFSEPSPTRQVVLAWRKSYPRPAVIEAVRDAFAQLDLPSITAI